MTPPSPHALASTFVAEHLKDWIAPSGPVMVGSVRTTAAGKLAAELATLLVDYGAKVLVEHDRKWLDNHGAVLAEAQKPSPNPVDAFLEQARAAGFEGDLHPETLARMRGFLEARVV